MEKKENAHLSINFSKLTSKVCINYGGAAGIRTLAALSCPTRFRVTPLRPAWVLLRIHNAPIITIDRQKIKVSLPVRWQRPFLPWSYHSFPVCGESGSRNNPWYHFLYRRNCRRIDPQGHTGGNSRTGSWTVPPGYSGGRGKIHSSGSEKIDNASYFPPAHFMLWW